MRYAEIIAAINDVTSPEGPFPVREVRIGGDARRVFGGVPDSLRDYYEATAGHGNMELLVDRDRRLTFAEVFRLSSGLGAILADDHGVKKGDRVAIAMRNSPEWCISFMAITSIGAVAVPLNSWWQGKELEFGLRESEAALVIIDDARYRRLASWLPESGLTVIGMDLEGRGLPAGIDRLEDRLANLGEAPLLSVEILPEDPATILFTSGSTGRPRGVLSTQRNVLSAIGTWLVITTAASMIEGTLDQESQLQPTILLTVPLFHVTGLNSMFLFSLGIGRKIVFMRKWDVKLALELIQSERVTHFGGVPTMSMELMDHPRLGDYDVSSLADIASGGAARPAAQVRALIQRFPEAYPSAGYGLTETNAVGCINTREDYADKPGSVGPPTPPLVEARILDDAGNVLPPCERGEVCLRSPALATGYLNQPAMTAASFVDGWFHTGDVGYLDHDGFLYIVDRIKDIIIRGGENVSCSEVEAAMYTHPDVEEAIVFSLPDERLGEIVGAAVKARASSGAEESLLKSYLSDRLAAFKVPQHIRVGTDSLPRIASGKIDKRRVRDQLMDRLGL